MTNFEDRTRARRTTEKKVGILLAGALVADLISACGAAPYAAPPITDAQRQEQGIENTKAANAQAIFDKAVITDGFVGNDSATSSFEKYSVNPDDRIGRAINPTFVDTALNIGDCTLHDVRTDVAWQEDNMLADVTKYTYPTGIHNIELTFTNYDDMVRILGASPCLALINAGPKETETFPR